MKKKTGKRGGYRPPSPEVLRERKARDKKILALVRTGLASRKVGAKFGLTGPGVLKIMRRHGVKSKNVPGKYKRD
jgi:hypothetical protein